MVYVAKTKTRNGKTYHIVKTSKTKLKKEVDGFKKRKGDKQIGSIKKRKKGTISGRVLF